MTVMQLHSGILMDLANPKVSDINIYDIALALSCINRFNGHTKWPYSVAEHSVWVADNLHPEIAIYGLLHDAHEAYIGDITTPVAELIGKEIVEHYKNKIQLIIYEAFKLKKLCPTNQRLVKEQDFISLFVEKRDIMLHDIKWPGSSINVNKYEKLVDNQASILEKVEDFLFKFDHYRQIEKL